MTWNVKIVPMSDGEWITFDNRKPHFVTYLSPSFNRLFDILGDWLVADFGFMQFYSNPFLNKNTEEK
jgi:hypothetical protein